MDSAKVEGRKNITYMIKYRGNTSEITYVYKMFMETLMKRNQHFKKEYSFLIRYKMILNMKSLKLFNID